MPVGSPVAGSFSAYPGPLSVTFQPLSIPLSDSASELSDASGPVAKRPPHIALDVTSDAMRPPLRRCPLRQSIALAFYAGLVALCNAASAEDVAALREGDMRTLALHEAPLAVPDTPFEGEGGAETRLSDLAGEVTVVNFWATWCAPCREEMPTLAALQATGVPVATIAVGRQDPAEIDRFLTEAGGAALPRWRDPQQALARDMGILGLPVTVILDAEGQEVARLVGDADWSSPSAAAILAALAEE